MVLDQSTHSCRTVVVPLTLLALTLASAQVRPEPTRRLITQAIDESKRVELPGNTRLEANADNDRGIVPDSLPMEHMQLQLRPPMEKEEELDNLLHEIQDPSSPNYHKWLTPEQFKQQFSLAPEDIETWPAVPEKSTDPALITSTVKPLDLSQLVIVGPYRNGP